jgi:hypothetical protein
MDEGASKKAGPKNVSSSEDISTVDQNKDEH